MRPKPVVLRSVAERDPIDAVTHYLDDAGQGVALRFLDDVESSFNALSRHPAIGSPRYAHELDLESLRVFALREFPYLVFYVERDDMVDVWRLPPHAGPNPVDHELGRESGQDHP